MPLDFIECFFFLFNMHCLIKSLECSVREAVHCNRKDMGQTCVQIPPLSLTGCTPFFYPLRASDSVCVKEGNDIYLLEL